MFFRKHFWCFPHLERRIYTYLVCFLPAHSHLERRMCTCSLIQPAHSSYDQYSLSSKNYEPHAFYRKHFWCFPHLERRLYTYLVCFCQCTLATIDIPFWARIMNRTRFIESISGGFSHLERRNIHIYFLFLPAHSHSTALHFTPLNEMHELRIERSVNTCGLLRVSVNFFP